MRLNTKGRLAVTAMIDLAMRCERGPVPLVGISRRQQISLSYLEQLFGRLRRHDLVKSTRGPGGGYSLGRNAVGISVADIIAAVDDPEGGGTDVELGGRMARELWASLDARMLEYLTAVSLKDLVEDQIAKGVTAEEAPVKQAIWTAPAARPLKISAPNSVFALGAFLAPPAAEGGA
jgi:Rrf2 family iron-sulfur cluster assembly transcriptional regulator